MASLKPRLLVCGGGYADIPQIQAAKALGFYVITTGNREHDLGHKYSDEYYLEDFSDRQAMLQLAKRLKIDAVCASCNDFAALSAAYVAEHLNLPGHDSFEVAKIIHHKDLYRRFASANNIRSPFAAGFADEASAVASLPQFSFPLMIKPVDLTGGKGITKVFSEQQAIQAIERAFRLSRERRVVVEEFVEGSRHGITTFVRDGKVVFHFCDDEYYGKNPYLVSAASAPGSVSQQTVQHLIATIEKIAILLNLVSGLVHVQYIVDSEGLPTVIEICRRPPGDLYTRFVKHATGIDYPGYIVKACSGLDFSDLKSSPIKTYVTRHCIMSDRAGVISDVLFDKSIEHNVFDQFLWSKKGDVIHDELTQKLGIVFLRFDSIKEMIIKTKNLHELIKVSIENLAISNSDEKF